MKKKLFLLVLFLTLFTGCNATYNVDFNSDFGGKEELIIQNFSDYYSINDIKPFIKEKFGDDIKYETELINNGKYNLIITKKSSKFSEINEELKENFGTLSIDKMNNVITFSPNVEKCINIFYEGDSENSSINTSNLIINVKIPFRVKDHNALSVNKDVYTWEYNIEKCQKGAFIEYGNISKSTGIIFICIVSLFVIGFLWIFIKYKRNNKI